MNKNNGRDYQSFYLHFIKEEDYSLLEDVSNTLMKKLTHQTL